MMAKSKSILCTACMKDDVFVDAVKYCVDCNENMCKPCLRLHIKALTTSAHKLIGRDEVPPWMRSSVGSGEEMCIRHTDNVLNRFCEDHDILCCGECEVVEHSSCTSVVGLQEAALTQDNNGIQATLANELKRLSNELDYQRGNHREMQVKVRKSTVTSLAAVRDLRRRANLLFEELEKKAVDELNSDCIARDDVLEADIAYIDITSALLHACVKQIDDGGESSLQFLLRLQRGKKIKTDCEQLLRKIKKSDINEMFKEFILNPKVEPFLENLYSLGGFAMQKDEGLKLEEHIDVNIHHTSDISQCDIQDVAVLQDGIVVVTDFENEKIKFLNNSWELSEEGWLQMCSEPFAVCSTGEGEIAVTLPGMKLVQFLSLNPDLVLGKAIQVDEHCRGVAYSYLYDELYVSCGGGSQSGEGLGQIRVYKSGNHIHTFKTDRTGKPLTTQPMHVAVSNDGSRIHVADMGKGLVTLDRQGNVLSTFTAKELEGARGVCVDVNDNIIVSGHMSNNVLHVKRGGEGYSVLLDEADGIKHPTAVNYNTRTASLVVTSGSCDYLQVIKRKKRQTSLS